MCVDIGEVTSCVGAVNHSDGKSSREGGNFRLFYLPILRIDARGKYLAGQQRGVLRVGLDVVSSG